MEGDCGRLSGIYDRLSGIVCRGERDSFSWIGGPAMGRVSGWPIRQPATPESSKINDLASKLCDFLAQLRLDFLCTAVYCSV